jgi:hypothetical protein
MEEKVKSVIDHYVVLIKLIKERSNKLNIIEVYDISKRIYEEIKEKNPSLKIVDKIDEAIKIFNENPRKYIDTKSFEIEI